MKGRSGHYFLWFVVFGLIAGLVSFLGPDHTLSSESIWLLVSGLLGLAIANKRMNEGKLARFYDFIVGVIFALAGIIGVAAHFTQVASSLTSTAGSLISGTGENATLLGLSLALFPAIVHLLLGITSFMHGMNNSK
jgi:hypothetical protein